jgi:hypothetical protein
MLPMKNKPKNTRAVTYRRYGIPALILEGKWLTGKYRLNIGDVIDIDYQPKEIRLRKNPTLSKERQTMFKEKAEIRRRRIQGYTHDTITNQDENVGSRSIEVSEG